MVVGGGGVRSGGGVGEGSSHLSDGSRVGQGGGVDRGGGVRQGSGVGQGGGHGGADEASRGGGDAQGEDGLQSKKSCKFNTHDALAMQSLIRVTIPLE